MKNLNQQLSNAVQELDNEKIRLCIEQGADVNFIDEQSGETVFTDLAHLSIYQFGEELFLEEHQLRKLDLEEWEKIEIMKLLLEKGADINLYKNDKGELGVTALYTAVNNARVETVKFLLDNGANPNLNFFPDEDPGIVSTVLDMAKTDKQISLRGFDERLGKIIELLENKGAIRMNYGK